MQQDHRRPLVRSPLNFWIVQEIFQKDESSVLRLSLTAINCRNDGMLQEKTYSKEPEKCCNVCRHASRKLKDHSLGIDFGSCRDTRWPLPLSKGVGWKEIGSSDTPTSISKVLLTVQTSVVTSAGICRVTYLEFEQIYLQNLQNQFV